MSEHPERLKKSLTVPPITFVGPEDLTVWEGVVGQERPQIRELEFWQLYMSYYRNLEFTPIPIDWILWAVVKKLLKTREGMKTLERVVLKWLDTESRLGVALAQSSAGNPLAAYSSALLMGMMMEHNYMIKVGGAGNVQRGLAALQIGTFITQMANASSITYAVRGQFPAAAVRQTKK